jgi:hypothetical protein
VRSSALVAIAACGGAPPPTQSIQNTGCPDTHTGDVVRALSEPVALDIVVLDLLSWGTSCTTHPQRVVRVGIDRKPWCSVTIDCTTTIQAPPRAFPCTGPPVAPGARTLGVEIDGLPASLMLRTMSLPAFDRARDGTFVFGAHVDVWANETQILIDPPTANPTLMM